MNARIAAIRRPKVKLKYSDSKTLISIALLSEGYEPSAEG